MGGGIGAAANLDVWVVLGFIVVGAIALAWSELRGRGEDSPEDPTATETPTLPGNGVGHQGNGVGHLGNGGPQLHLS